MTRSSVISMLLVAFIAPISACTWVALTPEAERVEVRSSDSLNGCHKVGTTKARSKASVGIFARSDEKVAEELATLARNDAPELGGNTVVADGPVAKDGTQRFTIYSCTMAADANH